MVEGIKIDKDKLVVQMTHRVIHPWHKTKGFPVDDIRRPERMPTVIKVKRGKGND